MTTLSQSTIAGYAKAAGLKGTAVTIASSIAMAESGGNTDIINPGTSSVPEYSVGLWQINLRAHPQYTVASMQNPTLNAAAMYSISSGGKNWQPWSTYTNGAYLSFMGNKTNNMLSVSSNGSTSAYTAKINTNPDAVSKTGSGYAYVLAYIVAIAFFILLAQSRAGYRAIYYGLLLCILFLFVTQSQFIANALAPLTTPQTQAVTQQ
jgi:hypothetical protein